MYQYIWVHCIKTLYRMKGTLKIIVYVNKANVNTTYQW